MTTRYDFLIDTYETERLKTLSVWSMFADGDLQTRPHPTDTTRLRGKATALDIGRRVTGNLVEAPLTWLPNQ